MLLTRPMNHHHFQQTQQQQLDQLNQTSAAAFVGHATPSGSLYYTQDNNFLPSVDNQLDLGLAAYDAVLDADSPPPLMRSTDHGMHDTWLPQQAKPAGSYSRHISHNRDSSLGSLSASGTASGPASPASPAFTFTSTPQIAVTDDGQSITGQHAVGAEYYQLAKSFGPQGHDAFYPNYPAYHADPSTTAATAYSNMLAQQLTRPKANERGLLPPPELSASSRSRPVSVASSVVSADSPATPAPGEPEERRSKNVVLSNPPKFERTMTDVFNDELFHPNFAIEASSPSQAQSPRQAASPTNELFAQRLQAANSQHMSPNGVSRDRSPFRNGSPLAPSPMHDFGTNTQQRQQQNQQQARQMGFSSAQQIRERVKAEQDAEAMRQQMQGPVHARATPQTVSPKDVALEFPEADNEANNFPLFPQGPSVANTGFPTTEEQLNKAVAAVNHGLPLDFYGQIPQQYPFVAVGQMPMPQQDTGSMTPLRQDLVRATSSAPSQASSMGHQQHQQQQHQHQQHQHHNQSHSHSPMLNSPHRPVNTRADGGTYSCTYHGCTLRFETPALLQKHKREGHRQGLGVNGRKVEGDRTMMPQGMTSSLLNTQQGPHRCDRINPSTNKPCATIFSRPYDLTRHEDTIHNGRKQKVRCQICVGEEKTFSRADALTRHYRVVHPDLEVPGKHRRRAMASQHQ